MSSALALPMLKPQWLHVFALSEMGLEQDGHAVIAIHVSFIKSWVLIRKKRLIDQSIKLFLFYYLLGIIFLLFPSIRSPILSFLCVAS